MDNLTAANLKVSQNSTYILQRTMLLIWYRNFVFKLCNVSINMTSLYGDCKQLFAGCHMTGIDHTQYAAQFIVEETEIKKNLKPIITVRLETGTQHTATDCHQQ
jgi:hypothetical protein